MTVGNAGGKNVGVLIRRVISSVKIYVGPASMESQPNRTDYHYNYIAGGGRQYPV